VVRPTRAGPQRLGVGGIHDGQIAEAIVHSFPARALDIWKKLSESCIVLTQTRVYEQGSVYLRELHDIFQQLGLASEWPSYRTALRHTHARKRCLLEVLDDLEGQRIIER
jgi:uncharacterized Zn finger protein